MTAYEGMTPESLLHYLQVTEGGQVALEPILSGLLAVLRTKSSTLELKWRNRSRQRLLVLGISVLERVRPHWGVLSLAQQIVIRDLLSTLIGAQHIRRDSVVNWGIVLRKHGIPTTDVLGFSDA